MDFPFYKKKSPPWVPSFYEKTGQQVIPCFFMKKSKDKLKNVMERSSSFMKDTQALGGGEAAEI
jgi:hypothetical protein